MSTAETTSPFRGKDAEAYVWMRLLQSGMVPYVPLIDAEGIDLVVKGTDGQFVKLQVKSRGFPLPSQGAYGEQIKDLWWGKDSLPFDYLVIVLPLKSEGVDTKRAYEAWAVPHKEVLNRISKGGDLTLTVNLLRGEWQQYHEQWRF